MTIVTLYLRKVIISVQTFSVEIITIIVTLYLRKVIIGVQTFSVEIITIVTLSTQSYYQCTNIGII